MGRKNLLEGKKIDSYVSRKTILLHVSTTDFLRKFQLDTGVFSPS